MGSYPANNTVQQLSVWTQTPAHRSTDNLESFLISRNYTEGLIVLCSPWKWNMLHWGLMVKDIACRSYIIERSWMSNQWEKMQQKQQYTSPQSYTASSPLWASQQRGTCVMWCTKVPEGGVHWQVLHSVLPNCQTAALQVTTAFFSSWILNRKKRASFLGLNHVQIMSFALNRISWNSHLNSKASLDNERCKRLTSVAFFFRPLFSVREGGWRSGRRKSCL